jgi:putative transposase
VVTTEARRAVVAYVARSAEVKGVSLSERRACRYVGVHRALCRYVVQRPDDHALRERIKTLACERPRWGVPRLVWRRYSRLRRDGWPDNHKRIERIYREEGLAVHRRTKKRVARPRVAKPTATAPNERWSMDFVRDTLASGRVFRAFTLVDDCTRECPVIEVDTSLSGERIVRVLDRVAITRGLPTSIVCDNGPEFVSRALDEWAHRRGVALLFIRPGHPVENCYIESFNGKLRDECLNQHWFLSLADARTRIETWRDEYNTARPHRGLAQSTPLEFARRIENDVASQPTRLSA